MAVDTATYVGNFNPLLPTASDPKSEGDDNIRQVKAGLVNSFPNVKGQVLADHLELSYVDGVTSSIQTQLDSKGSKTGASWTGAHDFTAAAVTFSTPTSANQPATKAFAESLAFSSALPAISSSTAGKVVVNNGATASWADSPLITAETLFLTSF